MDTRNISVALPGLKLKGKRDYLQGPDILVAALRCLSVEYPSSDITAIDIVFHGMARAGLTIAEISPPGIEPTAQLSCRIDGDRKKFALFEDGRSITERCEYPEENIVRVTDIQVQTASATSSDVLPYSNIERWVAMLKALHIALYPELRGKWLFVRGKFSHYQDAYAKDVRHQIVVEANFNNKLTRSALMIDGERLGDMYFSLE